MFEGFVLRQPRISSANKPTTSEPSTEVLTRNSTGSGDTDREEYVTTFIDDLNAEGREYVLIPAGTANLFEGTAFVLETPEQVDTEGLVYQFNIPGRSIKDFSVTAGDAPDSIDLNAGLLKYNTLPGTPPTQVQYRYDRLKFWYTRNDPAIQRFGFNNRTNRWEPLPGSAPEYLGLMPEDALEPLSLALAEPEAGSPRVVAGSLDNAAIPVTYIPTLALFQDYLDGVSTPNAGEAVAYAETGQILFAPDLIASFENQPVFQYRFGFYSFDSSTGFLGVSEDTVSLYLNPVPGSNETPLIRSRYGSYLTVAKSTDPVGSEAVRYDVDSGKLTFANPSDFEGLQIFYDGVYSTLAPLEPYASTNLGSISANFLTTNGISNVDASVYDRNGFYLHVLETGQVISQVRFVEDPSDFPVPGKIPAEKAFAYYDEGANEIQIQLSFSFMRAQAGNTLAVGTGDYYVEDGITFRMPVSFADPGNSEGVPDAYARERVLDEVLIDGIQPGAFAQLPQIPLQDVAGYGENTFFRIRKGSSLQVLEPDVDVVYDFPSNQIRWAKPEAQTQNITQTVNSIKLPHEVLLDRNYTFELDEDGQGFQPLVLGETVLADFDSGQVSFAQPFGKTLYEGFGAGSGSTFTVSDPTFDFLTDIGAEPSTLEDFEQPLLLLPNRGEVFRIVDATPTELTLEGSISPASTSEAFRVLSAPDVVYEFSFEENDLKRRAVFVYLTRSLDSNDPNTLFVPPEAEDYSFFSDDLPLALVRLEREELGALSSGPLFLDSYYLDPTAQFELYRDSTLLTYTAGVPSGSNEFTYDGGTGELTFFADDLTNFPDSTVILRPQLSAGRVTGEVEVLEEDLTIGLPSDLVGEDLEIQIRVRESSVTIQASTGRLFFENALRAGDRLSVSYYPDDGTNTLTQEDGSFRVRETLTLPPGSVGASFAAGANLDLNKPGTFLVNGSPQPAAIDLTQKTLTFSPPAKAGRIYQVDYFILDAIGGEQTLQLTQPIYDPPVQLIPGSDQTFLGDQTDVLEAGKVLEIEDLAFRIVSASYDAGQDVTEVEVFPEVLEDLSDPNLIQVSTTVVGRVDPVSAVIQPNLPGAQEIQFFGGDFSYVLPENHLLYLDGAPYRVLSSSYDVARNVTTFVLNSKLTVEYTSTPTIEVSAEPFYGPFPATLETNRDLFSSQEVLLIKMPSTGSGNLLERGVQFDVTDGGTIALDPTNTELPQPGERWFLSYLARETVGPFTGPAGVTVIPRLRSTYTRFIAATADNFAGASLEARYSYRAPDSFYFRALPLAEYAEEVAADLANRNSTSFGALSSFGSSRALYEQGTLTILGEESDAKDQDRSGRRFIAFYNDLSQLFEAYLQALDGRVIGDRSGQFKFFLAPDDTAGGEDPVTGELLPYYANPDGSGDKPTPAQIKDLDVYAQEGFIRNSIDDNILISRKPFAVTVDFPFDVSVGFQGTFQRAWEPSRLSRFYPQRSTVAGITSPDQDDDGSYSPVQDFGQVLADLGQTDIISIETVEDRPSSGWVIDDQVQIAGTQATLNVGMVFDVGDSSPSNPGDGSNSLPNLERGDPERFIPGFTPDQLVNLGRVTYSYDPTTGLTSRETTVYAQNMVVVSVSGDEIVLGRADQGFFDGLFPGSGFDFGTSDSVYTDPASLLGAAPAAGYTGPLNGLQPQSGDTLFSVPLNPYRQGLDFGLDASEGELTNRALPDYLQGVTGQRAPSPLSYIQATINYKNQRTEPFRFPALDGGFTDDDGLQAVPYGGPLQDSESVSFAPESAALNAVLDETVGGLVEEVARVNGSTLSTTNDLTDPTLYPNPPGEYDLLLLEGETAGGSPSTGGSTPFQISDASTPNEIKLAAFNAYQDPVSYTIDDAFTGTGTGAGTTWTDDALQDFTVLTGMTGTLFVGATPYSIVAFNNGSVEVAAGPLPASGSFEIDVSSNTGEISTLHSLREPGVDFSSWAENKTLSILGGVNAGVYTIATSGNEFVEPLTIPATFVSGNAAISVTSVFLNGTGSRNGVDPTIYDVVGVDFTPYSGTSGDLLLLDKNGNGYIQDTQRYEITTFGNQLVQVDSPIALAGASEYYLVSDDASPLFIADGAVDLGSNVRYLYVLRSLSGQDLRVGDTVLIEAPDENGGSYKIVSVDTSSAFYDYIELDRDLEATSGVISNSDPNLDQFPVRFLVSRPRRFSQELEALQEAFLARSVIYRDPAEAPTTPVDIQDLLVTGGYENANPSGPSQDILDNLVISAFGNPISQGVTGEIVDLGGGEFSLRDVGQDFISDGVEDTVTDGRGSFVLIREGFARGFYRVDELLSLDEFRLADGNEFSINFLPTLMAGSPVSYEIYSAGSLQDRTYELILYEVVNVGAILERLDLGIAGTIHNPSAFASSELLSQEPGDLTNLSLSAHLTGNYSNLPVGVEDRSDFILLPPGIRDEIEGTLAGGENLYDQRFAWIDFRLNLENGTLPGRKRLARNREKRIADRLRNLLRTNT